jgi:hypothetical protein
MYVIMIKGSDKVAVFKEKKALSEYIDCSIDTIRRKQTLSSWKWNDYIVFNPFKVVVETARGGQRRH